MPTVFVNGKKVNIPGSATPEEISRAGGRPLDQGRRIVKMNRTGKGNDYLKSGMRYGIREGERFTEVPDRVKAFDATYGFARTSSRARGDLRGCVR